MFQKEWTEKSLVNLQKKEFLIIVPSLLLFTLGNDTEDKFNEMWENLGSEFTGLFDPNAYTAATPPPDIQCMPAPGPFLPCNDLFDWWTLRCSVWIVFLLALLGNGCVVIVLIASR